MDQKRASGTDQTERYQLIVESLKEYAVFTIDKDSLVTTWNSGAEGIFLYKSDEIVGRNGDILYTPEDIAAMVPSREMKDSLADGKAINERFHVKKDRSRFWGSGIVFPLYDKQGQHIGFTKIMRNTSDAEQAETNLREEKALAELLISTYSEPIVILNSKLTVMNATPSFAQLFSLNKQTFIGKNFYQITNGSINMPQLRTRLEPVLKTNNYYTSFEVDYEHPQRGTRSVLVKPRRIYQPPNLLFSLEFEDLTDNKAVMEEKDIFISIASHEIRTPLSVIKAYGQILERELNNAKPIVKRAVLKINEQINFMSSLITALLDTSKITTGKLILEPEVFNLCSLIAEQVESFNLTQTSHQVHLPKEADLMVYADKVRTGSVITNLLSNAVKYSPNSHDVNINIEATADHRAKVSVQDFGIGIPVHEQAKLFQRFGRTDLVKQKRIPGTGLGLHLAAEIVKLQGGEIGFTSAESEGSTFYFSLPLYERPDE
ncbi:PAS domain-containing sensor histidine kinase [Mucilaginibacter pocheonensis]|uniref:histidine kinase n=1 Tax=Mucilaginibacter pocheonensis TaxID=398050 RepID=A0ABU1TFZ0_9SPHI|nr:ATP-binding protein [Mucilaginibacter pocheonensis]MDR6944120.1 PAS domain S-box-containing protein [Mucilaginibacter pocheonensis]